jgi:hypothetical protein
VRDDRWHSSDDEEAEKIGMLVRPVSELNDFHFQRFNAAIPTVITLASSMSRAVWVGSG